MAQILTFSRNKTVRVEKLDEQTLNAYCRLNDTLFEAQVEIKVKLPDLEILEAQGEIFRYEGKRGKKKSESLNSAAGIRIGPGLKKILRGKGELNRSAPELIGMIEDCCSGVILAFTKEVMLEVPQDKKGEKIYFTNRVKTNIRLYNSCAAFAPGSPLVEGIEPPE